MVVMRVEAKPLQMTYAQAHHAHAAGCYTGTSSPLGMTLKCLKKDVHVDASIQHMLHLQRFIMAFLVLMWIGMD